MSQRTLAFIGGSGGLGQKVRPLVEQDYRAVFLSSADLDVTNGPAVHRWMLENAPEIVVNAAVRNTDAVVHKIDPVALDRPDASVVGLTNLLRYALPQMRNAGFGRIIHLSSVLSRLAVPGTAIYSAGKAYGEELCRVAAVENAAKGVTVNCIRLGYFDAGLKDRLAPEMQAHILASIPAKRWGRVNELYAAIRFLVDTEYATGTCLDLTGGL